MTCRIRNSALLKVGLIFTYHLRAKGVKRTWCMYCTQKSLIVWSSHSCCSKTAVWHTAAALGLNTYFKNVSYVGSFIFKQLRESCVKITKTICNTIKHTYTVQLSYSMHIGMCKQVFPWCGKILTSSCKCWLGNTKDFTKVEKRRRINVNVVTISCHCLPGSMTDL